MSRNRLADETSPYLLQHADNPVHWWPWGDEALAEARRADRPILLSVGYSACHWCHVMAHESFEDPEVAALMNRWFVNVKVDREERPDLDQLYQTAVQLLREGHGGWPLTVFLTPDLTPFWGGTYFPPTPRYGMPSFPQILEALSDAWRTRRGDLEGQGASLLEHVRRVTRPPEGASPGPPDAATLARVAGALEERVDPEHGGFGYQPKFPNAANLAFLLRTARRAGRPELDAAVRVSLDHMAAGGIYDHLGGGFHRYSVDREWLVPHFEKMLYDNAALTALYTEAWQATGEPRYARVVEETVAYVLREMQSPDGGFYSTQDADSEGEEGRFFLWDLAEVEEVLDDVDPAAAGLLAEVYDVTADGNFEGRNILHLARPVAEAAAARGLAPEAAEALLARAREALLARREGRVRPGRDDKVLTAWNGLMIGALADAARAFGRRDWAAAAARAAAFVDAHLVGEDGSCLRAWKDGRARFAGSLDDHAHLADGLLRLYEATGEARWLARSLAVTDAAIAGFADEEAPGAWFFTPPGLDDVALRLHSSHDGSTPAGAATLAGHLLRLAALTGRGALRERAEATLARHAPAMARNPFGFGTLLVAADLALAPPAELVVAGEDAARLALLDGARAVHAPGVVIAHLDGSGRGAPALAAGLTEGRVPPAGGARAWLCRGYACQAPTEDPQALAAQLAGA